MTEQTDTPKILDEISKSNAAKPNGRSSRQQQIARRRFLVVLVLFLPIVAGVGFLAYQQLQLQDRLAALTTENQRLTQTLSAQSGQLEQFRQQLAQAPQPVPVDDSSVREVETALNAEILTLRQQLAELRSRQATQVQQPNFEWKVLEAEYLLGIANQKLQLEADLGSAIALAEEADAALLASGSNNVFAVRQAIATELAQLRGVEVVDRDGIYLRIANLTDRVDDIDLLGSMRQNFENRRGAESTPVQIGTGSEGFIDSMFSFLSSVFVWRKWEETPEAMLAPGQESYIKQSLRLMLEQARLALLDRDNTLYQRSLGEGRDWLRRYALTDSAIGQSMLAELEQLIALDIDPDLPTLNQSLNLISQVSTGD